MGESHPLLPAIVCAAPKSTSILRGEQRIRYRATSGIPADAGSSLGILRVQRIRLLLSDPDAERTLAIISGIDALSTLCGCPCSENPHT